MVRGTVPAGSFPKAAQCRTEPAVVTSHPGEGTAVRESVACSGVQDTAGETSLSLAYP